MENNKENKYKIRNLSDPKDRMLNDLDRYKSILDYHLNSEINTFKKITKRKYILYSKKPVSNIKCNPDYLNEITNEMKVLKKEFHGIDAVKICEKINSIKSKLFGALH